MGIEKERILAMRDIEVRGVVVEVKSESANLKEPVSVWFVCGTVTRKKNRANDRGCQ